MARNTRTFTDLDFNFLPHPATHDVTVRYDENAIKQSIRNLVLTRNFERPFRSNIGCQVKALLFEPITPILTAMIERTIGDTISNYEPRVDLLGVAVKFSPENNDAYITVMFKIKNTQTPVSVNLILERTR
jgi:phage baseplate assembly protein W